MRKYKLAYIRKERQKHKDADLKQYWQRVKRKRKLNKLQDAL